MSVTIKIKLYLQFFILGSPQLYEKQISKKIGKQNNSTEVKYDRNHTLPKAHVSNTESILNIECKSLGKGGCQNYDVNNKKEVTYFPHNTIRCSRV